MKKAVIIVILIAVFFIAIKVGYSVYQRRKLNREFIASKLSLQISASSESICDMATKFLKERDPRLRFVGINCKYIGCLDVTPDVYCCLSRVEISYVISMRRYDCVRKDKKRGTVREGVFVCSNECTTEFSYSSEFMNDVDALFIQQFLKK